MTTDDKQSPAAPAQQADPAAVQRLIEAALEVVQADTKTAIAIAIERLSDALEGVKP